MVEQRTGHTSARRKQKKKGIEPQETVNDEMFAAALRKLIFVACLAFPASAFAIDASDLSDMEGWTIVAVTSVEGEFEGCDFDKKIGFRNGWVLTCSDYSYSYSYQPDAVIFAKTFTYKGRSYYSIKALIDDEFYNMEPIPVK